MLSVPAVAHTSTSAKYTQGAGSSTSTHMHTNANVIVLSHFSAGTIQLQVAHTVTNQYNCALTLTRALVTITSAKRNPTDYHGPAINIPDWPGFALLKLSLVDLIKI